MERFGRGDAAAFEALYHRHEKRVFGFLMRTLRHEAMANDVMQEVWFAVAQQANRYQPLAKFTTWLFTIAHNRMVDTLRRLRPHESLDHDGDGTGSFEPPADQSAEPAAALERGDQARAIMTAVAQLPSVQREAFLMQAEGDLSVEDIAIATGSSFETVKSRLRYARDKLRRVLTEYA